MLRFQFDVLFADTVGRTIEGVIVPYGEAAIIDGTQYRFLPGSVQMARARTPLLLDHDRSQPVGVLAALTDGESGPVARFRVDQTPAGDQALTQAASGSRGAFSVGATVEASSGDDVIDVSAATVHEVSLVSLGAFAGAAVTRVAAEADDGDPGDDEDDPDEKEEEDANPDQTEMPLDPFPAPPTPEEAPPVTAHADPAPVILAERSPARRELTAGEYVHTLLAAQMGDREAARTIQAALTETISTDIPGLLPPTYESSVIGPAPVDRILYNTFRGRALPGVGLQVQKPTWTTLPAGAWAATVDADATTSKAVIGLNAAAVERWDWATALSYTAVQRSSPDAITTIYAAAVENFYLAVETKISALAITAAGAANAAVKLGAGIAAFYTASNRVPDVILVAPDVWGLLADAGVLSVPYGVSGNAIAGGGGLQSSYAGLPIVCSGALPATTKLLATRRSLDVRITDPVQLTANAIGALNVELGVVGEGLFDADVVKEIMLLSAGTPVGLLETQAAKAGKSD